jgi:hypothetical protein
MVPATVDADIVANVGEKRLIGGGNNKGYSDGAR